jgi:hypothetical protein
MEDEDDIYNLFMAGQQDDPEAQGYADALAGSASKNRGLGLIGQLTGDRVLGKVGGSLLDIGKQKEGIVAHAGQTRLMAAMAKAKAGAAAKQHGSEMTQKLRKEFMGNQVVKATQEVSTAWNKMRQAYEAGSTPASDISMVYGFMRMQDPGSTVREGEYATAENAGSVDQRVVGMYNRLLKGGRLHPTIRADFMKQATGLFQSQMDQYKPLASEFGRYATQSGIAENDVVPNLGFDNSMRRARANDGGSAAGDAQPAELDLDGEIWTLGSNGKYQKKKAAK